MSRKFNRKAVLCTVMAVGVMCAFSPMDALAVTAAQKKAEVKEVKARLDAMANELESAVESYNATQITYGKATAKVKACKKKIKTTQKKIDAIQDRLNTSVKTMYRTGASSYMDVLMGVESFDDFASVWDELDRLNAQDADLVVETKKAKAELESAKKELDEQEAEAKNAYEEAAQYKASIETQEAEYTELYESLSEEYQELLAKEEEERERAAAAAAAAYYPSGSSSSSNSSSSSGNSNSGSSSSNASSGSSSSESSDNASSSESEESSDYSGGSANGGAVARAEACLGLPYVWGGTGPNGYDCSGLVGYALTGSHTRQYVSQDFWAMPAVSDPQPGDVVACHAGHCAVYIGNGQMIEAPKPGDVVKVSSLRGGKIVRP